MGVVLFSRVAARGGALRVKSVCQLGAGAIDTQILLTMRHP